MTVRRPHQTRPARRPPVSVGCEPLERRQLMSVSAGATIPVGEDPLHDLSRTAALVGNDLYYVRDDIPFLAQELWFRDGDTGAEQRLLRDFDNIANLTVVAGQDLYFTVSGDSGGFRLFTTDGTVAGTTQLREFTDSVGQVVAGDDELFIVPGQGTSPSGGVWRSDGTVAGTVQLTTASTRDFIVTAGGATAYFLSGGLWRTDGTVGGTTKLKTLTTNHAGRNLAAVGDTVYFIAQESAMGLYASNGTAAGTAIVRPFDAAAQTSASYDLTALGDALIFAAVDATNGDELWRSDGTAGGTGLLKDLRTGPASSTPTQLLTVGDTLYFVANGGPTGATTGRELYKTDGTADGTVLAKDITPGGSTTITEMTDVAGTLYFSAATPDAGRELWRTDGSDAGAVQVNDMFPGPAGSSPRNLLPHANGLYLFAVHPSTGYGLFLLPPAAPVGTAPAPVADSNAGVLSAPRLYPAATDDGRLYLAAGDGTVTGRELYSTEPGSIDSIALVSDILPGGTGSEPRSITAVGNLVLFSAEGQNVGREPFRSDGTSAGTFILGDMWPGFGQSSDPFPFIHFNGAGYFSGRDSSFTSKVWRTDGTAGGTVVHATTGTNQFVIHNGQLYTAGMVSGSPNITEMKSAAGAIYFSAGTSLNLNDREPYRSTGTGAAVKLREIANGGLGSSPREFTAVGSRVFFSATDLIAGRELWVTDGTEAGTRLVKDIRPPSLDPPQGPGGPLGSRPNGLGSFNGRLIFSADDAVNGDELWISDGTEAGTVMLADINPGAAGSAPSGAFVFENRLYFTAEDGASGRELWATDGTAAGTFRVADINPGAGSSNSGNFVVTANGDFVFSANDGVTGVRLYTVDLPPGELTPPAPPRITTVFVDGNWTQTFSNHLAASGQGDATYGFAIDPADSLDELPWTSINRFSVRFSEEVDLTGATFALRGVNVPNRQLSSFTYDAVTRTATWTTSTIGNTPDKLALDLTGVTGALSGAMLDGGASAGGGGTVRVRLNVLPGDANRSGGSIIGSDVTLVRNAQNSPPGGVGSLYTIFKDVNGNAVITGSDVTGVRILQGRRLPAGEPPALDTNSFATMTTRKSRTIQVAPPACCDFSPEPLASHGAANRVINLAGRRDI